MIQTNGLLHCFSSIKAENDMLRFFPILILIVLCSACGNRSIENGKQAVAVDLLTTPTKLDTREIDSLASKMLASKDDYRNGSETDAEEVFIAKLLVFLKKPESFNADFPGLKKFNIEILSADDGKMRIFYWLSPYSGSMWQVQNIIQYQTPHDSIATLFSNGLYEHSEYDVGPTPFFEHIYALRPVKQPTYLLLGNGQFSGMEPYGLCRTLTWEHGKFNINNKIFKDGDSTKSELFTAASLIDDPDPENTRKMLTPAYNPQTKTLTFGLSKNTKDGSDFTGVRKSLVFKDGIFQ